MVNLSWKLSEHWNRILFYTVFLVSLAARLVLSVENKEANDDHVEVINWIVDKNDIPTMKDCWECSQPKFFYIVNAGIISALQIKDAEERILTVQLFNFFLGFLTLLVAWRYLKNQHFSSGIKTAAFALLALNPGLMAIHVQPSNDTLGIFAGTLVIYFADLFFRRKQFWTFLCMAISVVLACSVKGTGLALLLGLLILFAVFLFAGSATSKKSLALYLAVFLLVILGTVPFTGGYYQNYKKYGNAFINNIPQKDPPPLLFQETYTLRPGITSILHGYFTFRLFGLFEQPFIFDSSNGYPKHRTSLWSQLYGHSFFMHFGQHPPSWKEFNLHIVILGRWMLSLALVPFGLFLAGFFTTLSTSMKFLFRRNAAYFRENVTWMHLVFSIASLLFIIKYTYDYRDFATMKAIFVFPVLISFLYLGMHAYSKIKNSLLEIFIPVAITLFSILSFYEACYLADQLRQLP